MPPQLTAFCPPLITSFTPPTLVRRRPSARPPRRSRTSPRAVFPHPATSSSPHPNRPPDYYANVGTVIDTLRNDVPKMLYTTPDMSIYTDTLTFSDGSGYRITGKEAYKTVLWLLRAQARLVFSTAFVVIQSMYHDDYEGCVYLRWRMTAHPRWSGMATCVIDGMSVYRLDNKGWVYEHSLENTARRRDRRLVFHPIPRANVRDGRVVGAGIGAGGLPGWYRTLYQPAQYVQLEETKSSDVKRHVNKVCLHK